MVRGLQRLPHREYRWSDRKGTLGFDSIWVGFAPGLDLVLRSGEVYRERNYRQSHSGQSTTVWSASDCCSDLPFDGLHSGSVGSGISNATLFEPHLPGAYACYHPVGPVGLSEFFGESTVGARPASRVGRFMCPVS